MTRQRQVILEEIKKVRTHPTADQLYEIARRRVPHISLGTVYRNLEILSECGMIQKLELGGTQRRFDGNTKDHYHIHCLRCGRLDDVPIEAVVRIQTTFRGASDYEMIGHKLELVGLCPQCKKAKKALTNKPRRRAGRRSRNHP
ncbi:MAG: transcriptional repressor [Candidatus Zixiibacteriota bacterium]